MSEQKQASTNWISRLDALDQLAEYPLDKTAAWERLSERVAEKKSTKKLMWYWVAAASCIMLLCASLLLKQEQTHDILEAETAPLKAIKTNVIKDLPIVSKPKQELAINNKNKRVIKHKINKTQAVIDNNASDIVETTELKSLMEPGISTPQDSISNTVVAKPFKKLKVVHINELNQPQEEKDRFAHSENVRYELKVLSGPFSNSSSGSYSRDDNILKIKLSPNN